MKHCFQIHPSDNVATLLQDAENERLLVQGRIPERYVDVKGAVSLGHKVALSTILPNTSVIKYGVPIGVAIEMIQVGQWVHLHNCRSRVDERSNHLDAHSGIAKDIPYE